MIQLVHKKTVFYPVSAEDMIESVYERRVKRALSVWLPDFFVVSFKSTVVSEHHGSARADLALIDTQYRYWFVVEVELTSHPLHGHVMRQVRAFKEADYGVDIAKYLAKTDKRLSLRSLTGMLKGLQPKIVVVADKGLERWATALHAENIILLVVELFESNQSEEAFRVIGRLPAFSSDMVSKVEIVRGDPKVLRVTSPAGILAEGEVIRIFFDGFMTTWSSVETKDGVYLIARSTNPLKANECYKIIRNQNNALEIVLR